MNACLSSESYLNFINARLLYFSAAIFTRLLGTQAGRDESGQSC
jgi:hypothetical protein